MGMVEIAQSKVDKRGHVVYLDSIGNSSGRYKFKCYYCSPSFSYHEGEWFGWLMDNDCPKKVMEELKEKCIKEIVAENIKGAL